jgi:nitrogen-specific signal transduction histidine kinase
MLRVWRGALKHLFEPFFTTKPAGEGLAGTALSADVVRAMGGELSGRNEPEGGAEFSIRFTSLSTYRKEHAPFISQAGYRQFETAST